MTTRKNPIERRLELIHNSWVEFAQRSDARVLCWLVRPDDVRMVETFIAVESHAEAGTLPELFVQLNAPFEAQDTYGFALSGEFCRLAERLHQGLEEPETPQWVPPQATPREDDLSLWIKTSASFKQHYALPGHFVSLLQPQSVSDGGALQIWLQRFAGRAPEDQRLIVLDPAQAPGLAPLVQAEPVRVVAHALELDMAGARLEISQEAGALDTPGGKFRHLFVKMSNALGEMRLDEAANHGGAALAIAHAEKWFALAVPIHFALGAALAGTGKTIEANQRYLEAERVAAEGESAGDASCTRLRAEARMARGGLLISIKQYPAAGELFLATIPLASATQDPRMVLDCYRLASFSFEQSGEHDKAWKSGVDGLGHAKTLDEETRRTSTLPYLGEGLLRLTRHTEYSASSFAIERELTVLMGTRDWRPHPGRSAAPAPSGSGSGA